MFPRGLIGAAAGAAARSSEPDRGMGSCDPLFLRSRRENAGEVSGPMGRRGSVSADAPTQQRGVVRPVDPPSGVGWPQDHRVSDRDLPATRRDLPAGSRARVSSMEGPAGGPGRSASDPDAGRRIRSDHARLKGTDAGRESTDPPDGPGAEARESLVTPAGGVATLHPGYGGMASEGQHAGDPGPVRVIPPAEHGSPRK